MLEPKVRELYSAADTQEAYFLKNLLADAGIESRITEDSLLNAVGDLPASAIAPRIWVRAKDFEKARTVVVGYEARREVVTTKSIHGNAHIAVNRTRRRSISAGIVK